MRIGNTVHVSGTTALDASGALVGRGDAGAQAVQTLKPGTPTEVVTQAETQASVEVKVTVGQPTTTSTTTTAKTKKKATGNK